MKSREEIIEILKTLKPYLGEKYAVSSMALFGSVARNEQISEQSDIDMLIDFSKPIGLEIVDLADELEAALGSAVDIVSRKFLKPHRLYCIQEDILDV